MVVIKVYNTMVVNGGQFQVGCRSLEVPSKLLGNMDDTDLNHIGVMHEIERKNKTKHNKILWKLTSHSVG